VILTSVTLKRVRYFETRTVPTLDRMLRLNFRETQNEEMELWRQYQLPLWSPSKLPHNSS